MAKTNVVDPDGVRVCADKCDTCIFRPGNLMYLNPGRVKGMVQECLAGQGHIPCHKTLDEDVQAICRGFWDAYRNEIDLLRLAERIGFVKEVVV
jgi:hypothetical protein